MLPSFKKKENGEPAGNKVLFQIIGIIFLLVIAILIFYDFKIYRKKQELISQINSYKERVEQIKKSNQTLKDQIANADSKDYLEKVAYEQLGQQKPGEKEFIFIQPPEKPKEAPVKEDFWSAKSWFGWISETLSWIKNKF